MVVCIATSGSTPAGVTWMDIFVLAFRIPCCNIGPGTSQLKAGTRASLDTQMAKYKWVCDSVDIASFPLVTRREETRTALNMAPLCS